jgi:prolipoprotein diacylglyceryltransferase
VFPTLYHFLKDTLGIEIGALQILNTFGFFVALAIAGAFWSMSEEMKRRGALGQFKGVQVKTVVGAPFPISDYVLNGLLAFVFGYKVLYLLFNAGQGFSPQEHLFSYEGSWVLGLMCMGVVLGLRYRADVKQRLPEPIEKIESMGPEWHMGNITTVALISGFLGAKVFHILEDPKGLKSIEMILSNLFSTGGWTFYGGLICGAAGVLIYCRKKGLSLLRMLDSGGPAMMLAYGIGRFGCHFSGDGDWGIANTTARPSGLGWLPDWAWSYTYPHNVLGAQNTGVKAIAGCEGDFCYELAVPVYPTPLYEALMGLMLFFVLWKWIRTKVQAPGNVFAWYMVFAGAERFLIENIREHGESLYRAGGMVFSQAQLISLILLGVGLLWLTLGNRIYKQKVG